MCYISVFKRQQKKFKRLTWSYLKGKSTVFTFCHKLLLMGLMLFGETICFNCPFLLIYGNIWLKIRWAKGRNKIVNSNIIIIKHLCFTQIAVFIPATRGNKFSWAEKSSNELLNFLVAAIKTSTF